jgi:hypothetical protein
LYSNNKASDLEIGSEKGSADEALKDEGPDRVGGPVKLGSMSSWKAKLKDGVAE